MTQHDQHTRNGLNLDQMAQTVEALKNDPALARFQFRARNQWIDGGENRSSIRDFYGAGAEDTSRTEPFVFTNGEPPVLLGANEGANPVEYLLHALAGCVTTTTVLHAAARGIRIHRLSTELTGDIDLQGFLALDDSVPVGYESIRIRMDIEADATDEEIDRLLAFAREHSPVCSTVCKPVPVTLERVARDASQTAEGNEAVA
ncbi:OsmC family protein [Ectothiorhodospira lacustris]|uniref:OsmC family protein n=1 Tax=Ectothiorhodospira lacustris TaxID=2899127 RepID=UPI001EE884E7|nr:OsmC family protein [Ectothiorhodospira lacustris]MCG5510975.1 OsmC family protein [Ectothiorhodospira lacustris]MCG5522707.1 OsmC family protein [Ectothiorhodospira lacustris]